MKLLKKKISYLKKKIKKTKIKIHNNIQRIILIYLNYKFKKIRTYSIKETLDMLPKKQVLRKPSKSKLRKGKFIVVDKIKVRSYSRKFYFFMRQFEEKKKIVCPICKMKADYFKVMPTGSFGDWFQPHYTFNLFGLKDGKEILFDIDHIKPVSKGGRNVKTNLRILCHECNNIKADIYKIPKRKIKRKKT